MPLTRTYQPALCLLGVALIAMLGGALAQQATSGPSAKPLASVDLGPEIEGMQGRVLRMQLTTYQPGASNAPHSHKDRPEVVYMLQGKVIEHQGSVAKEYGPGDAFTANKDTTHWFENKGTAPAVLLVSTVVKPQ